MYVVKVSVQTNDAGLKAAPDFGVQLLLEPLLGGQVRELSVARVFRRANFAQDARLHVSTQIANAAHVVSILTRQSILRHLIVLVSSHDGSEHLLVKILFQNLEVLLVMLIYNMSLEVVGFHILFILICRVIIFSEEISLLSLLVKFI